jgi:hypothetical protein
MLNWAIIKHPLNWAIVLLMLVIAGFIVDILAQYHAAKNVNVSGAHAS